MADREEIRTEAESTRAFAGTAIWVAIGIGVVFVVFLVYFTLIAPERIAAPTDVFNPATPSEGIGVPDGGDLTNAPAQAAP